MNFEFFANFLRVTGGSFASIVVLYSIFKLPLVEMISPLNVSSCPYSKWSLSKFGIVKTILLVLIGIFLKAAIICGNVNF